MSDMQDTSREAYESIQESLGAMQYRVYEVIRSFGEAGCIMDDVKDVLEPTFSQSGVTSRFSELERKGWVVRDGTRRKGRHGRWQYVMKAVLVKVEAL